MLDAFIIEEIKRREEELRRDEERPRPSLPVPDHVPSRPARQGGDDDTTDRGVIIIDYSV